MVSDTPQPRWCSCGQVVHCHGSLEEWFPSPPSKVRGFVAEQIELVLESHDAREVFNFWTALGVEPDTATTNADLNLHWAGGRLKVHDKYRSNTQFLQTVSGCMLSVFSFKQFTDSRWCTAGASCKSLVASMCVGLGGFVKLTRSDPKGQ